MDEKKAPERVILATTSNDPSAHLDPRDLEEVSIGSSHRLLRLSRLGSALGILREAAFFLKSADALLQVEDPIGASGLVELVVVRIAKLGVSGSVKFLDEVEKELSLENQAMLKKVMELRHKSFAHSDPDDPLVETRLLRSKRLGVLIAESTFLKLFSSGQIAELEQLVDQLHSLIDEKFQACERQIRTRPD